MLLLFYSHFSKAKRVISRYDLSKQVMVACYLFLFVVCDIQLPESVNCGATFNMYVCVHPFYNASNVRQK